MINGEFTGEQASICDRAGRAIRKRFQKAFLSESNLTARISWKAALPKKNRAVVQALSRQGIDLIEISEALMKSFDDGF